jgi:hypothetical protein
MQIDPRQDLPMTRNWRHRAARDLARPDLAHKTGQK